MIDAVLKKRAIGNVRERIVKRLMRKLLFERFSLRDVHHRAQHSFRLAAGAADYVSAIDNERVGAVCSSETIFVLPIRFAVVDMSVNVGNNAFGIIGMNAAGPGVRIGIYFFALIPEELFET